MRKISGIPFGLAIPPELMSEAEAHRISLEKSGATEQAQMTPEQELEQAKIRMGGHYRLMMERDRAGYPPISPPSEASPFVDFLPNSPKPSDSEPARTSKKFRACLTPLLDSPKS